MLSGSPGDSWTSDDSEPPASVRPTARAAGPRPPPGHQAHSAARRGLALRGLAGLRHDEDVLASHSAKDQSVAGKKINTKETYYIAHSILIL